MEAMMRTASSAAFRGGCDYQFAGGWVIGVAGDYAWTDADGSHFSPLFPGFVNHTKVDSLASVTGRLGYDPRRDTDRRRERTDCKDEGGAPFIRRLTIEASYCFMSPRH
jgi:hypothetical protein